MAESDFVEEPPPEHPKFKPFRLPKTLKRIPKKGASARPGIPKQIPKRIPKRHAPVAPSQFPLWGERPKHNPHGRTTGHAKQSKHVENRAPVVRISAAKVREQAARDQAFKKEHQSTQKWSSSNVSKMRVKRHRTDLEDSKSSRRREPPIYSQVPSTRLKKKHKRRVLDENGDPNPPKKKKIASVPEHLARSANCAGPDCAMPAQKGVGFCSIICKKTYEIAAAMRAEKENKACASQKTKTNTGKESSMDVAGTITGIWKKPQTPKKKLKMMSFEQRKAEDEKKELKVRRMKSRKNIQTVLNEHVAKKIEKSLFKKFEGTTKEYFSSLRELIQNLRYNKDLQNQLNSGSVSVSKLLEMSSDEMASAELAKQREFDEKAAMQERVTVKKITGLDKLKLERNDLAIAEPDVKDDDVDTFDHDAASENTPGHDELPPTPTSTSSKSVLCLVSPLPSLGLSLGLNTSLDSTVSNENFSSDSTAGRIQLSPTSVSSSVNVSAAPSASSELDLDLSVPSGTLANVGEPGAIVNFDTWIEGLSTIGSTVGSTVRLTVPDSKEDSGGKKTDNASPLISSPPKETDDKSESSSYSFNPDAPCLTTYDECTPVWTGSIRESKASPSFLASLVQVSGDSVEKIKYVSPKGFRLKRTLEFGKIAAFLPTRAASPEKHKLHLFVLQPLEGERNVTGYNSLARYCEKSQKAIVFDVRKEHGSGTVLFLFPPVLSTSSVTSDESATKSVRKYLTNELLQTVFGADVTRPTDVIWMIGVVHIRKTKESSKPKHKSRKTLKVKKKRKNKHKS